MHIIDNKDSYIAIPHDDDVVEIFETEQQETREWYAEYHTQVQDQIQAEDNKRMGAPQPIWIGRYHVIGLREGRDLQEHLTNLPRALNYHIEQYIPAINGYALDLLPSETDAFDIIREDPNVGFVVLLPRGYFSPYGWKNLDDPDDLNGYHGKRSWEVLQQKDLMVEVTDDGAV
ncbi:hypothetical protein AUEXF2481DRAFT_91480 [Aureobasidium subglaciale EXF-2481]|uniref:Uncharacterized protein n=1 Tax=Aureobasidium subglaciale (strain EXF-2481) TaxID=1043005 RepID=A0A074Y866_AURSE|nr:uncharacterized protein AUEXF2481DRAFT_91480 [Aureobasidium subglaciale EXF-2481]KEQ92149.1 hypothetical protein AUEXF2481DRAFT_91480 [Aureobasidium subglaciale EXF-2481]